MRNYVIWEVKMSGIGETEILLAKNAETEFFIKKQCCCMITNKSSFPECAPLVLLKAVGIDRHRQDVQ